MPIITPGGDVTLPDVTPNLPNNVYTNTSNNCAVVITEKGGYERILRLDRANTPKQGVKNTIKTKLIRTEYSSGRVTLQDNGRSYADLKFSGRFADKGDFLIGGVRERIRLFQDIVNQGALLYLEWGTIYQRTGRITSLTISDEMHNRANYSFTFTCIDAGDYDIVADHATNEIFLALLKLQDKIDELFAAAEVVKSAYRLAKPLSELIAAGYYPTVFPPTTGGVPVSIEEVTGWSGGSDATTRNKVPDDVSDDSKRSQAEHEARRADLENKQVGG